jgi:hypothetical protein
MYMEKGRSYTYFDCDWVHVTKSWKVCGTSLSPKKGSN